MSKKIHNPKSHAPAVYIPCWLIQVPVKLLSHGAKLVYGRLSQWCNESGTVFRSAPQLAEELGMCVSSIEKFQKELRECGLIGTFQAQAGGCNHFEFYDHLWMHEPIKEQLTYKNCPDNPPYKHTAPHVSSYTPPPYKHTDINNKEIKEIKYTTTSEELIHSSNSSTNISFDSYKQDENDALNKVHQEFEKQSKSQRFKEESLSDPLCLKVYEERWKGINVTLERLYEDCSDYWSQKDQLVYKSRFLTHLKQCPLDKYKDNNMNASKLISIDEQQAINEYISLCNANKNDEILSSKIEQIKIRLNSIKTTKSIEALAVIDKAESIRTGFGYKNLLRQASKEERKFSESDSKNIKDLLKSLKE